uniref:C2H2-type domain-containing protein n=1 Tax=Labrus bergylta TaxID=56723 RepID=A0A3Q3GPV0_9LABR
MLALCEVDMQRAKEKPDERPKLEVTLTLQEISTQEQSYLSAADVPGLCQSYVQNGFVQMGFRIKEEQKECVVDGDTHEVFFPSPAAVKKERDLSEIQPSVEEESNMSNDEVRASSKAFEGRCCIQIDFGVEEHADESETNEVVLPLIEAVKWGRNQQGAKVCDEIQPVSSDGSESESDDSDEEWVNRKGTQKKTKRGNDFAKCKKDRHVCPSCGKSFRFIHHFRKHIKTHTKPSDSQMELLSRLQNAHANKVICDVCNKMFTATAGLQIHLKSHRRMKDFQCQDCGKSFVQKEHLNVHMRTHSGERQYECDVCG